MYNKFLALAQLGEGGEVPGKGLAQLGYGS